MKRNYLQIKKVMTCIIAGLLSMLCAHAQIGYQISLLNTATGEARANETVNVTATITDSSGGVIYTGTQSATSNDFGVLSLSVGDADTFTNLDLQQHPLPFFIEVSANGAMISRSQILSVPVAEVARKLEPQLKLEDVVGTWLGNYCYRLSFNSDYTGTGCFDLSDLTFSFTYQIEDNNIYIYYKQNGRYSLMLVRIYNNQIWGFGSDPLHKS